jgi:hypothetical protein
LDSGTCFFWGGLSASSFCCLLFTSSHSWRLCLHHG